MRGRQPLSQSDTLDVFHDDEGKPAKLSNFEYSCNVRVRDASHRLGFTNEPLMHRWIGWAIESLDRDLPVQERVSGNVDHPHRSATDFAHDLVVCDVP